MSTATVTMDQADAWRPAFNPWIIAITVTLATFMEVLDTKQPVAWPAAMASRPAVDAAGRRLAGAEHDGENEQEHHDQRDHERDERPELRSLRVRPVEPPRKRGSLNCVSMLASRGSEQRSELSIRARACRSAGARLIVGSVRVRQPDLTCG